MERIKIMFSWVWAVIMPFVKQMITQAGPILAEAALAAVKATAVSMAGATDAEKRDHARALIVADLKARGIALGVSLINANIELALMRSKGVL